MTSTFVGASTFHEKFFQETFGIARSESEIFEHEWASTNLIFTSTSRKGQIVRELLNGTAHCKNVRELERVSFIN